MSRIGLSNVITASFIERFRGLAQNFHSGSSFTDIFKGEASNTTISNGLRLGAQTFASAMQGLNSSISFVNLARDTLQELSGVVDKMSTLAKRASLASTSEDGRRKVSIEYDKLALEFRQTVDNSVFGGVEYLTSDGLATLFAQAGLDKQTSDGVADLFRQFVTPLADDTLASESTEGSRPLNIAPGAYHTESSDTEFQLAQLTNFDLVTGGGMISAVNSVVLDTDTILNQNTGLRAPFFIDQNGTVTSLKSGTLTANVTLIAVNEQTGYSIIQSSENLFSNQNPSLRAQLFLLDTSGNVVHQITANASAGISFVDADITEDNLTFLYSQRNIATGARQLKKVTTPSLGTSPFLMLHTVVDSGTSSDFSDVRINNAGSYLAYVKGGKGKLLDSAGLTADAYLETVDATGIGFLTSDTVAFTSDGTQVYSYRDGDGAGGLTTLLSGTSVSKLTTLERDANYSQSSYFTFLDSSYNLKLYRRTSGGAVGLEFTQAFGSNLSVSDVSMAFGGTNQPDVGIVANASSYNGTSTVELYRLSRNQQSGVAGQKFSRTTEDPAEIFDGGIDTRTDAYRTLSDLTALKDQIEENINALDDASQLIGKNINLVRVAGVSFLDLAEQLKGYEDAQEVAKELRKKITANAGAALAQAENLEAIIVATLTSA